MTTWEGPRFHLRTAQPGKWTLTAGDQSALVVGRDDTLHLEDESTLCVDKVELQVAGAPLKITWKSPKPEQLEVSVPMKDVAPGPVTLLIHQFGVEKPDSISLKAYAEAASLERLTLNSGDSEAQLKGTRLDEVAQAVVDGITLKPAGLKRIDDFDQLTLHTEGDTSSLQPGKTSTATVELRDGRQLKAPVTVEPPRPQIELLSKGTQDDAAAQPSPVHLSSADDLPLEGRLVFFLKARVPKTFPRTEKVEVAATDGSFRTVLSLADNSLMLEDAKTALGVIDPLARFGASAFGPIQARAVSADGVAGNWLPLGTLVRLPGFKELRCPHTVTKPCMLTGSNLFLAASISATPEFDNPTDVALDFTGTQLAVPHPVNGLLYLKLRDDPQTVQTLTLAITPAVASQAALPPQSAPPLAQPPAPDKTQPSTASVP